MKLRKGSKNHSFGNTRDALYCSLVISTAFLLYISEKVWLAVRAGYQSSHSLAIFPPHPLRNSSISFLLICVSATHQMSEIPALWDPKDTSGPVCSLSELVQATFQPDHPCSQCSQQSSPGLPILSSLLP